MAAASSTTIASRLALTRVGASYPRSYRLANLRLVSSRTARGTNSAVVRTTEPKLRKVVNASTRSLERPQLEPPGRSHLSNAPPGDRLPTQRDLARKLTVNIGTVGRAYAAVQKTGRLSGEVGRGTFLTRVEPDDGPRSLRDNAAAKTFIDLSHSFPAQAALHPAIGDIADEMVVDFDVGPLLARQTDAGLFVHRAAGARWLARFDIDCRPDDVMITCGGQHGLMLALGALSRPGDVVMTEELVFYGLRSAAGMMGRSLIGIRMDREGLMPDYLDVACRRTDAKVLFCAPTLHNPTTATKSHERRLEIIEVCRRHDVMIVEDDVWNFMLEAPAVPLAAIDPDRVIHISSFSKIIGPGVRLGLLRMPRHVAHAMGVALRATTLMASSLSAEWVFRLVQRPVMDRVVAAVRREMRARQQILTDHMPEDRLITRPEAFYCWLKLTNGWSADVFAKAAESQGVGVTPFNIFEVSNLHHTDAVHVALNGAPNRLALEDAIRRLATLLAGGAPSEGT